MKPNAVKRAHPRLPEQTFRFESRAGWGTQRDDPKAPGCPLRPPARRKGIRRGITIGPINCSVTAGDCPTTPFPNRCNRLRNVWHSGTTHARPTPGVHTCAGHVGDRHRTAPRAGAHAQSLTGVIPPSRVHSAVFCTAQTCPDNEAGPKQSALSEAPTCSRWGHTIGRGTGRSCRPPV